MNDNLETKVVLKQSVLHGSNHPEVLKGSRLFTLMVKSIVSRLHQKQKETPSIGFHILLFDNWWISTPKS